MKDMLVDGKIRKSFLEIPIQLELLTWALQTDALPCRAFASAKPRQPQAWLSAGIRQRANIMDMRLMVRQSRDDLERHLQEQLGFLERSAEAFDAGYEDESKRLAVTIRVLVHDSRKSHSLLSQLDRKNSKFCDSAFELDGASLSAHAGLVGVSVGPHGVKHTARLDGDDPSWFRWVPFDEWWNRVVIRDLEGYLLTRRDLVLALVNKDGGAHVDPDLDEEYARLSRENALGRYTGDVSRMIPLTSVELFSIRQISHEILKTLRPGYEKQPHSQSAAIIGDMRVYFRPSEKATETVAAQKKVGRNEPCPCGSGRKFKQCHGAAGTNRPG